LSAPFYTIFILLKKRLKDCFHNLLGVYAAHCKWIRIFSCKGEIKSSDTAYNLR
jgi:hypothetical protein